MSFVHPPETADYDAAWQELLAEAENKPWLLVLLRRHGARVYKHFVSQYRRLLAQPARSTRCLQRRLGVGLAGVALVLALAGVGLGPRQAFANGITVDGTTCTLADAITAANTDGTSGGCSTGGGADILTLTNDIGLTATLPDITSAITIEGGGHTISRSSGSFRILTVSGAGNLTLNSATVSGGIANYGAGIRVYSATLTVSNSTLSGNSASISGGGIYAYSGTVSVSSSTLSGNVANRYGGGIFDRGTLAVSNSTLSGNSATYRGGGIYAYIATVTVANSTVSGNTAGTNGGGIGSRGGALTVVNSTLSGNSGSSGGGIYAYVGASVNVGYSTLSGNHATSGSGGGIFNRSGTVTVSNSTLSGNTASSSGGGIFSITTLTVAYSTLSGNSTGANGGGIYTWGNVLIVDSVLSGNTAGGGGGLNADTAALVTITKSTFSGNTAGGGGGILLEGNSTLSLTNSTLSGNSATSTGGGILVSGGTLTVANSTLTGNRASSEGGGIYNKDSFVAGASTLQRSLVSGNSAGTSGNEVYRESGTVTAADYNLFGHSGETDAQAFYLFTPGASDINATSDGTNVALASIVNTALAGNGSSVTAGAPPGSVVQTLALPTASPAIDQAPSTDCAPPPVNGVDQRGEPRNVNGAGAASSNECDIGAFEAPTVDDPPTAVPGGPYSGLEGSPIAVDGSLSTDNIGITHYLWDCTNDGIFDSGAAATANCTYPDNGAYTALLQVIDTVGQTNDDTAVVNVANVPPTATFVKPASVNEGTAIVLKLTNPVDPSSADRAAGFKHAFDCGNGSGFNAFASANSRSCATTDNGVRSVKGKIQDKDLGTTPYSGSVTIVNVPPIATLSAPASVNEGSAFALSLLNRTDPSSADTAAGLQQGFDCGDGAGFNAYAAAASRNCAAPADGPASRSVKGRIKDKDAGSNTYPAAMTVKNVAPSAKFGITVVTGTNKYTLKLTSPTDPSAADKAAGFTYSFDCGSGVFNAYSATTSRTCVAVVGTTYTVQGRIKDKDGGVRTYSGKLTFTLSPSGQVEPLIDGRSMQEVESQEQ